MSIALSTSFNNIQPQVLPSFVPRLEFQNSIKEGNAEHVATLCTQGVAVNEVLPNGEMPLHFAVRMDQQECIKALLQAGADPKMLDNQHVSAIDLAILMTNEEALANLLGCEIGHKVENAKQQIQWHGSSLHIEELDDRIKNMATVDVENLSPISKAAYEGNLEDLKGLLADSINKVDGNGQGAIHYAILGGQSEAVQLLIQSGANTALLTPEGNSLLHFAAINGSLPVLKQLMEAKINPNHQNQAGETALHYACAKENLAFVELLVKGKADPHLLDIQGMSPLAVIGTKCLAKDPLSLSKVEFFLFASTALYWISWLPPLSNLCNGCKFASLTILSWIGVTGSALALSLVQLNKMKKYPIQSLVAIGVWALPFTFPLEPSTRFVLPGLWLYTILQGWTTYQIGCASLKGLAKCKKNLSYSKERVKMSCRNATVMANTVSGVGSMVLPALLTMCFAAVSVAGTLDTISGARK